MHKQINSHDKEQKNIERNEFSKSIINTAVVANIHENFSEEEMQESALNTKIALKVLNSSDAFQEMLVAQMLSIHQLQQRAVTYATNITHQESVKYFTNAAIKLANCFTQQANLLSKLQGRMNQKITVEHVDVHQGGQAVVGNVIKK